VRYASLRMMAVQEDAQNSAAQHSTSAVFKFVAQQRSSQEASVTSFRDGGIKRITREAGGAPVSQRALCSVIVWQEFLGGGLASSFSPAHCEELQPGPVGSACSKANPLGPGRDHLGPGQRQQRPQGGHRRPREEWVAAATRAAPVQPEAGHLQQGLSSVSFCRPVWFLISGARVERQLSGSAIVVGNELPGTGAIAVSSAGQGVFRSPDGLRAALSRLELSSSVVGQCRPRNADQLCANGHATAGFAVWVGLSAASVACVVAAVIHRVITVGLQWTRLWGLSC
jgi:hypothetical protein